jgi:hypothetical protein
MSHIVTCGSGHVLTGLCLELTIWDQSDSLLEGETLRERPRAEALPLRKAVEYAEQAARGLAAAHEKGIVTAGPARGRLNCLARLVISRPYGLVDLARVFPI